MRHKIFYCWYLRRITLLALLGYGSGAICYWVLNKNETDIKLKSWNMENIEKKEELFICKF